MSGKSAYLLLCLCADGINLGPSVLHPNPLPLHLPARCHHTEIVFSFVSSRNRKYESHTDSLASLQNALGMMENPNKLLKYNEIS